MLVFHHKNSWNIFLNEGNLIMAIGSQCHPDGSHVYIKINIIEAQKYANIMRGDKVITKI
jgi:hypothetical protein